MITQLTAAVNRFEIFDLSARNMKFLLTDI